MRKDQTDLRPDSAICKELNLEASKVAYVFADQINGKNIYKFFQSWQVAFL